MFISSRFKKTYIFKISALIIVFVFLATSITPAIGYSNPILNSEIGNVLHSNGIIPVKESEVHNGTITGNKSMSHPPYVKSTLVHSNKTININNIIQNASDIASSGTAFNPQNGKVYITNGSSNTVPVLNDGINTIMKGGNYVTAPVALYSLNFTETGLPNGTTWYLTLNGTTKNSTTSSILFTGISNGTYSYIGKYCSPIFFSLPKMKLAVNGTSLNISIVFPATYEVNFTETNVPTGVSWFMALNNTNHSIYRRIITTSKSAITYLPNGTYYYYLYLNGTSFNGYNFIVNGTSLNVTIVLPTTYKVNFTETNVPAKLRWVVCLNDKNYSITYRSFMSLLSSTAYLPNGTYYYFAFYEGNINGNRYRGGIYYLNFTVHGLPVDINLIFPPLYNITFTETGLSSGMKWYVNVSNGQRFSSNNSTIEFFEKNGDYSYTVSSSDKVYKVESYTNVFKVANSSIIKSITFSKSIYNATFTETGLPAGTTWYVNLTTGVSINNITSGNITFMLPNGTYTYYATSGNNFYRAMPTTSFKIYGRNITLLVTFTDKLYNVIFTETGLSKGTIWSVTLNNETETLTTSTILFTDITNGTYSYNVVTISGYTVAPSSGTIIVSNNNTTQVIVYTHNSFTNTAFKLSALELYIIIGVVVTVGAIGGSIMVIKKRK